MNSSEITKELETSVSIVNAVLCEHIAHKGNNFSECLAHFDEVCTENGVTLTGRERLFALNAVARVCNYGPTPVEDVLRCGERFTLLRTQIGYVIDSGDQFSVGDEPPIGYYVHHCSDWTGVDVFNKYVSAYKTLTAVA